MKKKLFIIILLVGLLLPASSTFSQSEKQSEIKNIIEKPSLQQKYPWSDFSKKLSATKEDGTTYLVIPYLGEYISKVYKWSIGAASILAVIVIISSAIQWMFPALNLFTEGKGDQKRTINNAKKRIMRSISGLVLIAASYTLLYTINPELVKFKALRVEYVSETPISEVVDIDKIAKGETVTDEEHKKKASNEGATITDSDMRKIAKKSEDVNYCYLKSIIEKESGGKLTAVGHDENDPSDSKVPSRTAFLEAGETYTGKTFTPPQDAGYNLSKAKAGDLSREQRQAFNAYPNPDDSLYNTIQDGGLRYKKSNISGRGNLYLINDDSIDLNSPPEYGLDWRFSHGIGYGQVTLGPASGPGSRGVNGSKKIQGPNGEEWAVPINNKMYTVTDLLNTKKSIEATLMLIKKKVNESSNAENFFKSYSGQACKTGMEHYCECLRNEGKSNSESACENGAYIGNQCET